MAATKGDVVVSIGVDSSGVKPGLSGVEPEFRKLGGAAESGSQGIINLADRLREYRREETQQARSTRFFASELAQLLPVSNEVAGTFGKLAGALAGGFGIGLAFEAVKLLAETWTEHQRKLEETTKAAIANARDTVKATDEIIAAYRKMRQELAGGIKIGPADERLASDLAEASKIETEARQKASEPLARLAELQARQKAYLETGNPTSGAGALNYLAILREMEQVNKIDLSEYHGQMAKAATIRMTSGMERARTAGVEAYAKDAANEDAALKRLGNFETALAAEKAKVATGLEKFDADMRVELLALARADYSPAERKQLETAIRARYAQAKAEALAEVSDDRIRDRSFLKFDSNTPAVSKGKPGDWTDEVTTRRKDFEQDRVVTDHLGDAKRWNAELKDRKEQLTKFAADVEPLVAPIGNAFSGIFSDIVDGTASFTKTMTGLLRGMAQAAINELSQMFTKWIAMKVAMGFLGSGSSLAAVSGYGTNGMSLGVPQLTLSGARAAGGPVTAGRSYLVGERGPELFTAPTTGRIIPNDALGGSVTIQSANTCPSCQRTEMQAIAQETVRRDAPRAVANDMRNPNGRVSKGIVQNHQTARRR